MNHAVQDPLDINLDFSSKCKAVQPLPVLDIGEHGLGNCDPLVVDIPSPLRAYFSAISLIRFAGVEAKKQSLLIGDPAFALLSL
jgi:hypothetical protein